MLQEILTDSSLFDTTEITSKRYVDLDVLYKIRNRNNLKSFSWMCIADHILSFQNLQELWVRY